LSFGLGRPGPAAAVSIVMLAVVLAFTIVYARLQGREAA
jgi:multiple sugar transport system permease protein